MTDLVDLFVNFRNHKNEMDNEPILINLEIMIQMIIIISMLFLI